MTTRNVIGCCRKENKLYHQVVQLVPCLAIKTVCIFDSLTSSRLFSVNVFDRHVYRVSTDVSTNSVHRVLVDTYLVTKLHRRCRLTTDTPSIRYRYLTDSSPIYYWHTTAYKTQDPWALKRAKNIFTPKNINSITITIIPEGIRKEIISSIVSGELTKRGPVGLILLQMFTRQKYFWK